MRSLALLFVGCLFTSIQVAAADDAAEIKKLVPAASAMSKADFEKLAHSDTALKASDVEDKSLTFMLLAVRMRDDAKAREQFRYIAPGPIRPSELVAEIYRTLNLGGTRVPLGPVTMIQADRITGLTCTVEGDTAKGTISFEVPKLYTGKVDYVARKAKGKWRIEEFHMPAYEIHVALGKNGKWEQK
jgi:hypothetical protein